MAIDSYQKEILQHSQSPANFRTLTKPTHKGEGYNRVCGDHIQLFLKINKNTIEEITFQSQSCAIVTASASVMTQIIKNQTINQAKNKIQEVEKFLSSTSVSINKDLNILKIVKAFPSRRQCASLPWHSLYEIIKDI